MKITSICQPHFFPWLGYFNMIHNCDEFIFLDNVQYNRKSWQNRVYIKNTSQSKKQWLSMSLIESSRKYNINEVYLSKNAIENFNNQINENYKKSKYFEYYYELFEKVLSSNLDKNLAQLNITIVKELCNHLEITCSFFLSSNFNFTDKKENLILKLLRENKSKVYLANMGSLAYAGEEFFKREKVLMKPHLFKHPNYNQLNMNNKKKVDFIEGLSIIDLLFNNGKKSSSIIKALNNFTL